MAVWLCTVGWLVVLLLETFASLILFKRNLQQFPTYTTTVGTQTTHCECSVVAAKTLIIHANALWNTCSSFIPTIAYIFWPSIKGHLCYIQKQKNLTFPAQSDKIFGVAPSYWKVFCCIILTHNTLNSLSIYSMCQSFQNVLLKFI